MLTHAHADHYAYVARFLDAYDHQVKEYWFSFTDPGVLTPLPRWKAAAMTRKRGRIYILDHGGPQPRSFADGITVYPFGPSIAELMQPPPARSSTVENNRSLVLLIQHGRHSVLLGADAESARWQRIVQQATAAGISLASDLVKAPHHAATPGKGVPVGIWPHLLCPVDAYVTISAGAQVDKPSKLTIDRSALQIDGLH